MKNRKGIIMFAVLGTLYWSQLLGYSPHLSPYMTYLGASSTLIGLMLGGYGIPQIILRIPVGILTDNTGQYKKYIIIGNVIGVIACLCMWCFEDPWIMIVCRFFAGINASAWVCYTIYYGGFFSSVGTLRPQSHTAAMTYGGQVIAYAIATPIVNNYGYKPVFFALFIVSVICLILSILIQDNHMKASEKPKITTETLKGLLHNKKLWFISLTGFVLQLVTFSAPLGFTSQHASNIGATAVELTIITLVCTAGAVVSSLFISMPLTKLFGEKLTFCIAMATFPIYCFLLPLCQSVIAIIVLQLIFSLGHGISLSLMFGLTVKDIPYESQSAAMGFYGTVSSIGTFIGPFVVGLITDFMSLNMAFIAIGVISLIGPLFAILLAASKKKTSDI